MFFITAKEPLVQLERESFKKNLHRITVYLHSCEIAFLIENQICKTLGAYFFFCNHAFLLLSDAEFLVNNCLLSLVPSSVSCMEKRSWASSHSSICPKSPRTHGRIPRGSSGFWVGYRALRAVHTLNNQPALPCQVSSLIDKCAI